jgi:hypothetical protein
MASLRRLAAVEAQIQLECQAKPLLKRAIRHTLDAAKPRMRMETADSSSSFRIPDFIGRSGCTRHARRSMDAAPPMRSSCAFSLTHQPIGGIPAA